MNNSQKVIYKTESGNTYWKDGWPIVIKNAGSKHVEAVTQIDKVRYKGSTMSQDSKQFVLYTTVIIVH